MTVITTYLEQLSPSDLRTSDRAVPDARIERVRAMTPTFGRYLYEAVGGPWSWTDRLSWAPAEWAAWYGRPGSETWVAYADGAPAGYVELDAVAGESATVVEIAYFGLTPEFIGRGLGGHLLSTGVRQAWSFAERYPDLPAVNKVWVHTCSLDGPAALANYQARGFRIYRTESEPAD